MYNDDKINYFLVIVIGGLSVRTDALITIAPRDFDPTVELCGYSMIKRQIKSLIVAKPYRVIISGNRVEMRPVIKNCTRIGADFLHPDMVATSFREDIGSFIRGLTYLQGKCDRILVVPANFPLINIDTYKLLLASDAELAVAQYKGKRGYPALLSSAYYDEALQLGNLGALLDAHTDELTIIETDDEGVITDVCAKKFSDKTAKRLSENHSLHRLRPNMSVEVAREESFFGIGIQQILRLIDETGSLVEVRRMMGMSSDQAWKLTNRLREVSGLALIESAEGNGTCLTQDGREFLEQYTKWRETCEENMVQAFYECFPQLK